jgi:hypothetical protein
MRVEVRRQLILKIVESGFPEHFADRLCALKKRLDVDCNHFDLLAAVLKQPQLFYQRPETLDDNVTRSAALLGLEKGAFVAAALKQPPLFYQRPETLNDNVARSAALLGLEKGAFVAAALRKPQLFCQRPETLDDNVTRSSALLGLEKGAFVAAATKQPPLFYQRPETLDDNVTRSAALLGLQKGAFVAAALKQPQLFSQRPETLATRFICVAAIANGRHTAASALFQKFPAAVCYSIRHLHLRYVLTKVVPLKLSLPTLLSLSSTRAEALATSHFAGSPRTLQFMHAAGLIKTLPPGLKPIMRTRTRTVSL